MLCQWKTNRANFVEAPAAEFVAASASQVLTATQVGRNLEIGSRRQWRIRWFPLPIEV
jgi:hypothetical protein